MRQYFVILIADDLTANKNMDNPQITDYRRALGYVSRELEEQHVKELKSLCKDHLTATERENIKDGFDLTDVLEKKALLSSSNVKFLVDILGEIGLVALQQKLQEKIKGLETSQPTIPPSQTKHLSEAKNSANVSGFGPSAGSKNFMTPADFTSKSSFGPAAHTFFGPAPLVLPSSSSKRQKSNVTPQKSQSLFKGEPPNSGQSHISTSPQSAPPQNSSSFDRYYPVDPTQDKTSSSKAKQAARVTLVDDDVETDAPSLPRMKDNALLKNAAGVLSEDVGTLNVEVDSKKQVRNGACGKSLDLGASSGDNSWNSEEGQTGKAEEKVDRVTEEAMTEDQRLCKIMDREIKIVEDEANRVQAMYNLEKITIYCKECSALVCKASELRRKGTDGYVTCISADFKRWVREVRFQRVQHYQNFETVGLVFCGAEGCGNQFGTMQKFLNLNPPEGYALRADKFKIHFERGGAKTLNNWNRAGFEII